MVFVAVGIGVLSLIFIVLVVSKWIICRDELIKERTRNEFLRKKQEKDVRLDLQIDLFVELVDSLQVFVADIKDTSDIDPQVITRLEADIAKISSITPKLF